MRACVSALAFGGTAAEAGGGAPYLPRAGMDVGSPISSPSLAVPPPPGLGSDLPVLAADEELDESAGGVMETRTAPTSKGGGGTSPALRTPAPGSGSMDEVEAVISHKGGRSKNEMILHAIAKGQTGDLLETACGSALGRELKFWTRVSYTWPKVGHLVFDRCCRTRACTHALGSLAGKDVPLDGSSEGASSDDSSSSSGSSSSANGGL